MSHQCKKVIRFPALRQIVPVSRVTIYRWEKEGSFPKHVQLGKKSIGWLLNEVESWVFSKSANNLEAK